jgi:hypothetical protein
MDSELLSRIITCDLPDAALAEQETDTLVTLELLTVPDPLATMQVSPAG